MSKGINLYLSPSSLGVKELPMSKEINNKKMPSKAILPEQLRQQALDELQLLDTTAEERFDRITRLAQQIFGVESAAITLIDHDRQWFKSKAGTDLVETKRSDSFCDFTIRDSKVFEVVDASKEALFQNSPLVTGDPHIRFYAGYPLTTSGGENIGALCVFDPNPRKFSEAEKNSLRDLASLVQSELWVDEEFSRAAKVQDNLLPKQHLDLPEGYLVAGICLPAKMVGGDFYDWYQTESGYSFTIADIMGKGLSAAIIAATVRAVLRASISQNTSLTKTIKLASLALNEDLSKVDSFVTLFYALLDAESGKVRFIDAGHGLTIVIREDGSFEEVVSQNPPIGIEANVIWQKGTIHLNPGDSLISISDGVLELFDGTVETGLSKIVEIANRLKNPQAIVDEIGYLSNKSLSDDVTAIVISRDR